MFCTLIVVTLIKIVQKLWDLVSDTYFWISNWASAFWMDQKAIYYGFTIGTLLTCLKLTLGSIICSGTVANKALTKRAYDRKMMRICDAESSVTTNVFNWARHKEWSIAYAN